MTVDHVHFSETYCMASRVDWQLVEDQVASEVLGNLAHLDQDKIAYIFSTTFLNSFSLWKMIYFTSNFIEICSQRYN